MPTYKELAAKSISNLLKYSKESTVSGILLDVLEMLLAAERERFLEGEAAPGNKGNGHYTRFVRSLGDGVSLRVPRDRMGAFRPLILEVVKADEQRAAALACSLYTKGMSQRDAAAVVSELYGTEVSASWVSKVSADALAARDAWQKRRLSGPFLAVFLDAIFVPVRRGTVEREAVYVALGLREDGTREVLGLYTLPSESAAGWADVMADLKARGAEEVNLLVADGLKGLGDAVEEAYPEARFQSCVVHKMRNVLLRIRPADKAEVAAGLKGVFDLDRTWDTKEEAEARLWKFVAKWSARYPHLDAQFPEDLVPRLFTYISFPPQLRRMVYTTNWIERLNRHIRKVVRNKGSFPSEGSAMGLVFLAVMDFAERVYRYPISAIASL